MEKENNKNMWVWIGVIVLVIVVIFAIKMNKSDTSMVTETETQNQDALEVTEDTSEGSINAPTTAGVAPVTMSYANAIIKYKDARIQINDACQIAKPNNLTFKNGTTIMIDNRSKVAHTIKVGTQIPIKGYGFKLVKLSAASAPATWLVDCDSSQNVATILIQK